MWDLVLRQPLPGKRAVDLGCGTGRGALQLARLGFDVVGLDREQEMLEVMNKAATKAKLRLRGVLGSAESTTLPTASADLVTCALSLNI